VIISDELASSPREYEIICSAVHRGRPLQWGVRLYNVIENEYIGIECVQPLNTLATNKRLTTRSFIVIVQFQKRTTCFQLRQLNHVHVDKF
jgi:hypothetical protein